MPDDIAVPDIIDPRFGPKGNSPPPDLKIGEALREELRDNHGNLIARKDELTASAEAFLADHPAVEDDETSGLLAGLLTQLRGHCKIADQTRQGVKAPYLEGERIVDGFFTAGIVTPLDKLHAKLNERQSAYLRAKEARIRREAEERARKAAEEEAARRREAERAERERQQAEKAAREAGEEQAVFAAIPDAGATRKELTALCPTIANVGMAVARLVGKKLVIESDGRLYPASQSDAVERQAQARRDAEEADRRAAAAREAEERARSEREQQERVAAASAADNSRVRGDYAMASLRTQWKYRVVDIAQVPDEYLMVDGAKVNAAIRGQHGLRAIPGLEIYPERIAQNR